jgi:hypothetical protein
MSEKAGQIPERIASRLSRNSNNDVAFLNQSIEQLNQRIYILESQINQSIQNPKLGTQNFAYNPSQEKFNIAEAVVEELVEFFEQEKACMFEPNKSCDKCSMCSSRGF